METIDQEKYLKGKKQFRILLIMTILMFLVSDTMWKDHSNKMFTCVTKWKIFSTEILFFILMYIGEVWPIYVIIVQSILEAIVNFMMMAMLFMEIDWIIYVWPEKFIMKSLKMAVCLSVCALAIFGKKLRYFMKVNKMENKKREAEKTEQKDNGEETNTEA